MNRLLCAALMTIGAMAGCATQTADQKKQDSRGLAHHHETVRATVPGCKER